MNLKRNVTPDEAREIKTISETIFGDETLKKRSHVRLRTALTLLITTRKNIDDVMIAIADAILFNDQPLKDAQKEVDNQTFQQTTLDVELNNRQRLEPDLTMDQLRAEKQQEIIDLQTFKNLIEGVLTKK